MSSSLDSSIVDGVGEFFLFFFDITLFLYGLKLVFSIGLDFLGFPEILDPNED
jgi:hypothetical protein